MTIQDQYIDTVRKTQQTWAEAAETFESFASEATKAFGQPIGGLGSVNGIDPGAAIDQVFDFWEKTLEVQRDFAKKLVGVGTTLGETFKAQAESVGDAVREQYETAADVVRGQVESVKDAVHEQVVATYAHMTKTELQDELAGRDLPKTGNVDELRDRLIADDRK